MGWSDCGTDSKGRPIGYAHEATCDHLGCNAKIDRGLAYACGGMHGEDPGCEGYFCGDHLWFTENQGDTFQACAECVKMYAAEGDE